MMTPVTLQLPDELADQLNALAAQQNVSLESYVLRYLTLQLSSPASSGEEAAVEFDPITPLIGSLDIGTTELGENHDHYIGQALPSSP